MNAKKRLLFKFCCRLSTLRGMKALIVLLALTGMVQSRAQDSLPLWPEGAPGALGKEDKDIPTITVYAAPAEKATGAAMVICPGGGYGGLAQHEGKDYALWL